MLRINLLPPYIYEGSRRKKVVAFWVFALAAVIGGVLYIKSTIDSETEKAVQDKTAATPDAEEMKKKRAEAQKINGESAGIRGKADFVKGANEHSTKSYQKVVQNIAAYTWPKVMYDGIVADGASATMPAYAPSLADVGHYMIYMSHNKEISKVDVQMSSIPGFPDGGAGGQSSQASGVRPFDGSGHNFNVTVVIRHDHESDIN